MDLPSLLMAGSLDTLTSYFSVAFLANFSACFSCCVCRHSAKSKKVFSAYCKFCFLLADKRSVDCLFMPDNNGCPLFRLVA